jgi:hypothetical protein
MNQAPRLVLASAMLTLVCVGGGAVALGSPGRLARPVAAKPEAVSITRKSVPTTCGNAFRRATAVSVKTMFPRPWRVASSTSDKVEPGQRVVAEFAPLRVFGVKVPIEFTQIVPGVMIEYRYLPGGISTGLNRIEFKPMRDASGAEHTEVVHTSTYRITQPVLRALPFVYQAVHRAFVHGLIKRFGQALD